MNYLEYPHVPAAFINAIREEGTKDEACDWLQKTWNELCAVQGMGTWMRVDLREVVQVKSAQGAKGEIGAEPMKPPTITGSPTVGSLVSAAGGWDGPLKVYDRMTMIDAEGRVLASSLGSSVVVPLSAMGIRTWLRNTYSKVSIEPDAVGSYIDPPTPEELAAYAD